MSDSTNNLPQVSSTATARETTINQLFAAASPALLFAYNAATSSALTWGYLGGRMGGSSVANGTVALTTAATNYVVVNRTTLAVSASTSNANWLDTTTYGRAYVVVAGASTVTSYEDHRYGTGGILQGGAGSSAPTDAQYLVTEAHAGLSNERVLSAGSGITFTDVGGSPPTGLEISVAAAAAAPPDAQYLVIESHAGLSNERVLVAGSGITFTEGGGSPPTSVTIAATSTQTKVIQFACSDLSTALTPGTNKAVFRMPYAMTLTAVRASLYVADTGSPVAGITIDINESGASILSTKLTIDAGELTSTTAATPAVISDTALADDAEITVDIDSCGGNSKGLVVTLIGT